MYVIRAGDGSLYTGVTTDVPRRLAEHAAGRGRGARALRGRLPLSVAFRRRIGTRGLALRVERRIKRLPKSEKERLIRARLSVPRLLARLGLRSGAAD